MKSFLNDHAYLYYDSVFSLDNSSILVLFFSKYLVKIQVNKNKNAPEEVILPHLWTLSLRSITSSKSLLSSHDCDFTKGYQKILFKTDIIKIM